MYSKLSQLQKKKGTKKSDRKRLVKRLDDLTREVLKTTYPDECVTCGKKNLGWFHPQSNPYGLQPGHFISRICYALRWDFRNVWPQCSSCNYSHEFNPAPYAKFLIDRFGKEVLDELIDTKNKATKMSLTQLRETEEYLKGLL